jgi:hypothetical protein
MCGDMSGATQTPTTALRSNNDAALAARAFEQNKLEQENKTLASLLQDARLHEQSVASANQALLEYVHLYDQAARRAIYDQHEWWQQQQQQHATTTTEEPPMPRTEKQLVEVVTDAPVSPDNATNSTFNEFHFY